MPEWLTSLAIASLILAVVCSALIAADILRGHRQHMWIMNIVWPITALYSGPLGLWAYFSIGRESSHTAMQQAHSHDSGKHSTPEKPRWQTIGLATTHCGSGCTLGDLVAEGVILTYVPLTLFGHQIFAAWVVDFVFAFLFGIAFQYFSITPMKQLSPGQGLKAALKADTLSLVAWQAGMYGWMAIATFVIFDQELDKGDPVFWFMMQLAMLAGFATSYPANGWLFQKGIKETM